MSQRNRAILAVLALTLVGAVLRFFFIGEKPIWLDEAFSIWMAHHSLWELWGLLIRLDQHPPLYYMLLAFWQTIFGDLQGPVRTLSALCSLAAIPLFWGAARRLTDDGTAVLAVLILAISPFHIRYAQEARMYGLLTLTAAAALYFLVQILVYDNQKANPDPLQLIPPPQPKSPWIGLAVAQAAVMLTHNTAAVYFPIALNLAIWSLYFRQRRTGKPSTFSGINDPGFGFNWVAAQSLALLLWLPWAIPFVRQSLAVYHRFWLGAPDLQMMWDTVRNFNFAFLPDWLPGQEGWMGLYGLLALLGLISLLRQREKLLLLLSLIVVPVMIALLVSLRRPIFYDQTLIWITLPYYLLLAAGVRSLGSLSTSGMVSQAASGLQALALIVMIGLTGFSLYGYYFWFEKDGWDAAAAYVAEQAAPTETILFNATWVQLPFDYYYRHYERENSLRGMPADLFSRGELEPQMTEGDVAYLRSLLAGQKRIWLIYSHDWYTDPQQIIPRVLDQQMQRSAEKAFVGLRILRYDAP